MVFIYFLMWNHPLECWPTRTTTFLKETDPSSPKKPLAVFSSSVRAHEPLPTPCWNADCLDLAQVLCRQARLLWVQECSGPVLSRAWFCYTFPWPLALTTVLCTTVSWDWGRGCDTDVPVVADHSTDKISAYSMVVSLHVNYKWDLSLGERALIWLIYG